MPSSVLTVTTPISIIFSQVNNNGVASFNSYFSNHLPVPFPISARIIAPFWADIDTTCGNGTVFFRQTTSTSIRDKAANHIQSYISLSSSFYPSSVIIATWYQVPHYDSCSPSSSKKKPKKVCCNMHFDNNHMLGSNVIQWKWMLSISHQLLSKELEEDMLNIADSTSYFSSSV